MRPQHRSGRAISAAIREWLAVAGALACFWAQPGQCAWQSYVAGSGLTNNNVHAITVDLSGNLWFGTNGGASRFDGVTWRTFTIADGLDFVITITVDREGNLWFGTNEGASRFDGVTWRTFTIADGLAGSGVGAIAQDRAGNLWFGTTDGVSRFDGVAWRTFTTADGLAGSNVHAITQDRAGNLWFATDRGASRFDGTNWQSFTVLNGLAHDDVNEIEEDRAGNLWFGTAYGLSRFDGATWLTFTTTDGLAGNIVRAITQDGAGNLWFGTATGLSRFDGSTWRTFTTADGLVDDYIQAIAEDFSGNLWFGTVGGASRFDGSSWRVFTRADGLSDDYVFTIAEERSGNIWIGTLSGGASRLIGNNWSTFTTSDGLVHEWVQAITVDRAGNLWFGTPRGVSRFDGSTWITYTAADGLAADTVFAVAEDFSGNLWFGTYSGGASRFDGDSWKTFTTTDGLAGNYVRAITQDGAGNLWFGTGGGGVSRFDGNNWTTFSIADGLASDFVSAIAEDRAGSLWFGTAGGVSRFDGTRWETFTFPEGFASNYTHAVHVDRMGSVWIGTRLGVRRFDGSRWVTFTVADGLPHDIVRAIREDRSGNLWFGTQGGIVRYEPDRVPPRTVFLSNPPDASASRTHWATFVAAFGESRDIEFSTRLDEEPWSPWLPVGFWARPDVADGFHALEARSRDKSNNIDATPAMAIFAVDATPPAPVIAQPGFGQAVRGTVEVRGTAADARFSGYTVSVRAAGAASWDPPAATVIAQSSMQVPAGTLATWDTSPLTDGIYDIRLAVADSLGLTALAQASVVVDNEAPYADQTAPAKVPAATGGDIYTTGSEVHLYFPPHAFSADAVVMVTPLDGVSVSDTLASGAVLVDAGYEFSWSGGSLQKAARLEFSFAGVSPPPSGALALYHSADGTTWQRLGGTVDSDAGKISLAVTAPGHYALFADQGVPSGPRALSALSFTPRVFSPSGTFADEQVGISFTLGRPGVVTIKVYSRSGRLIREVVSGASLGAGASLIRWDGRDREGSVVTDGLYVVTVEAFGETEKKALAVVK